MKTQILHGIIKRTRRTPQFAIGSRKLAIFHCMLLAGMMAFAQSTPSPFLIPFQGRLTNPQGMPYTNGQYTVIFNLYDQPVGGTVLWSETHQKIGIINGMVNVFLGSINPLTNVDFSQTRHLGITIDADGNPNTPDPEMVPRQMIIPAFWAKNSEKLNGYDWTPIFNANSPVGPIPGGKIQNNSITAGQIAPQTIMAAQIANNTITSQQLAGAIITSNQIVTGSISSANLAPGSVLTTNIADGQVTLPKLAPRQTGTNVGVGGIAQSLPVVFQQLTSSSFQDISNLSITITTTGRPVIAFLVPITLTNSLDLPPNNGPDMGLLFVTPNGSSDGFFRLVRDGGQAAIDTRFGSRAGGSSSVGYPSPIGVVLDLPPAGTHTYKLQWGFVSSNPSLVTYYANLYNSILVVFEL